MTLKISDKVQEGIELPLVAFLIQAIENGLFGNALFVLLSRIQ